MANDDTLPEGMNRLLALFATDLAKLRFGDLDASVLEGAAGTVRAAARELAEAEALADGARAALETARKELLLKGQRALAYARVFAEGLPELAERLEGIALAGGPRQSEPRLLTPEQAEAGPRRRGRPPKAPAATGTLALDEGAAAKPGSSLPANGAPAKGAPASPAEADAAS